MPGDKNRAVDAGLGSRFEGDNLPGGSSQPNSSEKSNPRRCRGGKVLECKPNGVLGAFP